MRDQLPYATMTGLNNLAHAFVGAQKKGIAERFTVRRSWVLQHVRFDRPDRATKQKLQATVRLEPPGVIGGRSLLAKFERGGVDRPDPMTAIAGSKAIPIDAPRTGAGIVQAPFFPKNLGLQPRRTVEGGYTRAGVRGKRRTFVILPGRSTSFPSGGIFQRIGPGRRDLRLLFVLKPSVPIPPLLRFHATAQQVAEEQWERHFTAALEGALRTAH